MSILATVNGKSHPFWRVYNRVAQNWYELEYGVDTPSWYRNGMVLLESIVHDDTAEMDQDGAYAVQYAAGV
jgi:hypothetical protein